VAKSGLRPHHFSPAIHYQSPCIPLAIPWFRLRPALKIFKVEHFLSPQLSVTIDLVIWVVPLDRWLRSASFPSFSPEHALPDFHDLSMCPFQINGRDLLRQFGLREFSTLYLHFLPMLSPRVHDLLTRVSRRSTTMIHFGLFGLQEFFKLSHLLPLEVLFTRSHDL
jgi:hypothetical protein